MNSKLHLFMLVALTLLVKSQLCAQVSYVVLNGSQTVNLNDQITYNAIFHTLEGTITDPPVGGLVSWNNNLGGNTVLSQTDYSITIKWTVPGNFSLEYDLSAAGDSYYDDAQVAVNAPIPPTPVATSASNVNAGAFTANWNSSSGATNYKVDVSSSSSFVSFVPGYNNSTLTGTSVNVNGLVPGTTYYYRIRASNPSGTSGNSNIINVTTTNSPPGAPVAIAATGITSNFFAANWNSVSGATEYKLDVAHDIGFANFVPGYNNLSTANTTRSVSGLSFNTIYYYRVRAVNAAGTSVSSNIISVTTASPPGAPIAGAAADIQQTSFTASWSSVPGVTSYRIDVSLNGDFSSFISGYNNFFVATTSRNISGLLAGLTYYYRVRAVNSVGTSLNSNTISTTTIPAVPLPPTLTGVTDVTSSSFTVNWSGVGNATAYLLDISTNSDFSTFVEPYNSYALSITSKNVSGLIEKTLYYCRVRAVNASGNSAYSATYLAANLAQNHIRAITIQSPNITSISQVEDMSNDQKITHINFLDGLGRPMQSVIQQGSPSHKDVVQPIAYDHIGRENIKYLPYVSEEQNGWYKSNFVGKDDPAYASSEQYLFYQTGDRVTNDQNPYAETRFEASPMNRVLKQGSAGAAWQPDAVEDYASTDRTIKKGYFANLANEVLLWVYTNPSINYPLGLVNAGAATTPTYYVPDQLYKVKSKDEHHNEVIEYINKRGNVVLRRVQVTPGTWSTTDLNKDVNYASTYFVYDDFDNLVCVMPPEAVSKLPTQFFHAAASDNTKDNYLSRWAFRYKYDARKRIVEKAIPGASTTYMVYDNRDRLVASQDGVQRAANPKRWTFTKYDQLNRPIATGIKDTVTLLTQAEMQDAVDVHYAKSWARYGEEYIGETGKIHGYTNLSFPVTTGQETSYDIGVLNVNKYLTITYYDNYDFRALWTGEYDYKSDGLVHTVNGIEYEQPGDLEYNQRVIGQVTGMKLKSLDNGYFWLKSINYYDDKYRVIQTVGDNLKAGTDRISNLYDFVGKILKSKTTHGKDNIVWTERVGVKTEGNKLVRTAAGNDWTSSGAVSEERLQAGQDGWVEFIVSESHTARVLGLSDVNTNASNNTIDYAFSLSNNILRVLENGVVKLTISGAHKPEYVLRIERSSSTISYKRNGVTVYTSLTPSASLLMVDASIYNGNATLVSVRSSFSLSSQTVLRRFEYDHAGRLLDIYHLVGPEPQQVTWTSLVGVEESNGGLTKTSVSQSWNAGAFSQESIEPGQDGYVEFRAQLTNRKIVGFSDTNPSAHYNSIDYALYATQTGVLYAYENGASMAMLGHYTEEDVLRIERIDSKIYYKMNNAVLYESTVPSTTVLHVDCSLYDPGASIFDVNMGISTMGEVHLVHNEYNEVGQLVDKKLYRKSGSAFKQSVDYRYNIRGWLTSINNASLPPDPTDEVSDYFGMNLSYNEADTELGNDEMFNGNISGIKWSNYLGTATIKEKGYTYSYDPMNRILGSTFKKKSSSWSALTRSGNAETGFSYDLNGNIRTLIRNDERSGGIMDSLTYGYGTTPSNKLVYVRDFGDAHTGFVDGNTGAATDYGYDANGNMVLDKNKGIISNIVYNHLNLPETVIRGTNFVRYIYDAAGRKIAQVVTSGSNTKQTDYAGEFIYENDALQFINHEEGRVVVSGTKLVYSNPGETVTDFTASNATLTAVTLNGDEKYIQVTSTGTVTRSGVFPVGGAFPVDGGERYKIRVKGYRTGANTAFLLIKADGADLNWPGVTLANSSVTEAWIEQIVTIPDGASALEAGVVWSTVTNGESMYVNEFEIIKLEDTQPEYQYFMKDHLGNVRLTFTTKEEKESGLATLETANAAAEESQFLYYDEAIKVDHVIFDHTNAGPTYYSTRLTGGNTNAKFGLTKTLSLMPGDVVNMDVYAKYLDPSSSNWTTALNNFIALINGGSPPAGSIVDGGAAGSIGGGTYPIATINHTSESGTPPKAYLNYVVLDKSMENVLDMGYARITSNSREYGQDAAHDRLVLNYTAKEPGYIYIYLSNENPTAIEVYFDDFKVAHTKSAVVAIDDYYPFGLAFNSYQRENCVYQHYLYNGKEFQDELNLGWLDYGFRSYQPDIGRWTAIDPLSEKYFEIAPYAYVANNPIILIDPNGAEIWLSFTYKDENDEEVTTRLEYRDKKLYTDDGKEYDRSDAADPVFQLVKDQLDAIQEFTEGKEGGDEIAQMFSDLESTEADHDIVIGLIPYNSKGKTPEERNENQNKENWYLFGSTTYFNPLETHDPDEKEKEVNPIFGLTHELKHAHDHQKGTFKMTSGGISERTGMHKSVSSWEFRAVDAENIVRNAVGAPRRTSYAGVPVPAAYVNH